MEFAVNTNAALVRTCVETPPCIAEPEPSRVLRVGCITCAHRGHPSNMVNVYEGEYQCQPCRHGF